MKTGKNSRTKNEIEKEKSDPILFGASYFEEYLSHDRLDEDMELMESAGFNVIKVGEDTVPVFDKESGKYDFSDLDRIMSAAEKRGLYCIAVIPDLFSDEDMTDRGKQGYPDELMRAFVSHMSSFENVIGFQLNAKDPLAGLAGSEEAEEDEFSPEAERAKRRSAADFLRWQRDIVDEYKRRGQFVTCCFEPGKKDEGSEGYSWGIQSDICHHEAKDALTVIGAGVECKCQDDLTGAEIAFCGDLARRLKKGTYLMLDCQSQGYKDRLPYPGQMFSMAVSHIASGAGSIIYRDFASVNYGEDSFRRGLLGCDLEENETFKEVCRTGETFTRLYDHIAGIRKKNEIAIVVSTDNIDALEKNPTDPDFSYNDGIRWVYDALYEMNYEVDIIFENDDFTGYRFLVFPQLYAANDGVVSKVERFVKRGGVVFATFRSFSADDGFRIRSDRQPHGLAKVFGCSYSQYTKPADVGVEGCEARYWMELLIPDNAEAVSSYEHKYWGKYAAVTKNVYGMGRAWYLGTWVEPYLLKRYLIMALQEAQLPKSAYEFPVIIKAGLNRENDLLLFIFNYSSSGRNLILQWNGTELITGFECHAGQKIFLRDWGVLILKLKA